MHRYGKLLDTLLTTFRPWLALYLAAIVIGTIASLVAK